MRMLPLPPIPLMPPIRRSRWSPRGLVVASLVTAVSLALYATLQADASPRSVQPLAGQSGTASAGNVFPEDLVWRRPLNVGSAAGLFRCWPNAAKSSGDSVVVWTDKANHVAAFGAALDAAQFPSYAAALGTAGTRDASPFVQVAGKGHVVRVAEKKSALRLNDMQLDCVLHQTTDVEPGRTDSGVHLPSIRRETPSACACSLKKRGCQGGEGVPSPTPDSSPRSSL